MSPKTTLDRSLFSASGQFVLDRCRLLDGRSPVLNDAAVAVRQGQIAYAGHRNDMPANLRADADTVDLGGLTVMPGLIDCHAHLVYNGFRNLEEVDRCSIELATVNGMLNAQKVVAAGYTTVRDVGTIGNVAVTLRDAIAQNRIPGPRIVASGQVICATASVGDTLPPHWKASHGFGSIVDGPAEMRKEIRRQIRNGVDNIKLAASGVEVGPYAYTWMTTFSQEEVSVAVEEAHRWGRSVAVHAQSHDSVKFSLRAGADTVEHGTRLDEESITMFKESEAILVPTLCTLFSVLELGEKLNLMRKHREEMAVNEPLWLKSLSMAHRAGIPIAAGGDLGNRYQHGTNARELEFLVRAGLTPLEAVRAATSVAARAIKREHTLGTLEAGKVADILIVEGDPVAEITVLQDPNRLVAVVVAGELVAGRIASRGLLA